MLHYTDTHMDVHIGDCREVLRTLKADSVHCVVTSPPYWGLRDYGVPEALGLEPTLEAFIASMVEVFREVRRVLRKDGTLWLNMGDSYNSAEGRKSYGDQSKRYTEGRDMGVKRPLIDGLKVKDLVGMPWRLAFALQADGWYLRSDIIWSKPNPMPESVTDRPTKAHEYVFLLSREPRYYYDAEAVREAPTRPEKTPTGRENAWGIDSKRAVEREAANGRGHGYHVAYNNPAGRNLRSVWQIATEPYPGAHFATFPQKLVEPYIKAGTSERGVCPECGAPWVREVENGEFTQFTSGMTPGFYEKITTGWRPSCGHDSGSEYGRLLAERDRLIADGVDPEELDVPVRPDVERPWTPVPATVLDPFAGSGTTGLVANRLGRRAILIDLSAEYIDQAMLRNQQHPLGLIG